MPERNLRIGVLGCGMISGNHFQAWQQVQGAHVVAVCDPLLERAQQRAQEFGIETCYQDSAQMLKHEQLDAVDIITPRQTHASMIELAAAHGVHALCEKPLCPTHEEAQALLAGVGQRIHVMVNENWRYRSYFQQIAHWLHEGRLGQVVQARIALWRSNMLRRADGLVTSLTRQPFLAHEAHVLIAESLIHELDVARALFGELEVVACTTGRVSEHLIGEDNAVLLLRSDEGGSVVLDGSMTAAGHAVRAPDRVEIAGTRCSLVLEGGVLRLFGAEEQTLVYDEDEVRQACFNDSIQHFVDCLQAGHGNFWTSARDQLGSLRLMDRAYALAGAPRTYQGADRPSAPPVITNWRA
ncbi:Gfo/Idh/MocA family oxidoreductase [Lampropedia puyangensis]|uniref:Gfo/Idh/MocA family oxidoreductase n=1 Tax=Lampropedia puyangensis TaxID=1330072 RepID=A0A4S8ES46_9BURK|nr:Gfo/Idh/MocA family oxidoreductase [Lampropedia puyangensis]THT97577.1 Gfo/Idh/MocA family oxidoreductase [Lampropedia puyangensis]